jgi:hypothetical protein
VEPRDQKILDGVESEEKMLGLSLLGGSTIDLTAGVDQETGGLGLDVIVLGSTGVTLRLERVKESTTSIALISASAEIMADAALSLNETVREELAMVGMCTEGLSSLPLLNVAILPEFLEDLLHNLCLLLGGCSAENVKVDSEPVIDSLVKGVVLGAKVGGRKTFLESLCFGSGAIFVGATDVNGVVASGFAVTSKYISRKNTADDVTQMWDVVDVGKGRGDEDVALALLGQNW